MANIQKTMNATIVTGEYQNSNGESKKRYLNVGTLFIYQDGGMSLKIEDGISVSGNINFYEKQPKQNQGNNYKPQQQQPNQYGQQNGYNQPQQQYGSYQG